MRVIYYERWFILLTSVLVFVLPITAFQFSLPETKKSMQESNQEEIKKRTSYHHKLNNGGTNSKNGVPLRFTSIPVFWRDLIAYSHFQGR